MPGTNLRESRSRSAQTSGSAFGPGEWSTTASSGLDEFDIGHAWAVPVNRGMRELRDPLPSSPRERDRHPILERQLRKGNCFVGDSGPSRRYFVRGFSRGGLTTGVWRRGGVRQR